MVGLPVARRSAPLAPEPASAHAAVAATGHGEVVGSLESGPAPVFPAGAATSGSVPKRWRHPLPADFLAIPATAPAAAGGGGGWSGGAAAHTSTSDAQMAEDEAMARMFADELFMAQLQRDPEVAAHMRHVEMANRARLSHGGVVPPTAAGTTRGEAAGRPSGAGTPAVAGPGFMASMSAGLRSRIAAIFSRRRPTAAAADVVPTGTGSTAAASAPAGAGGRHERTGLLEAAEGADGVTEIDLDVIGGDDDDDDDDGGVLGDSPAGGSRRGGHSGFEPLV